MHINGWGEKGSKPRERVLKKPWLPTQMIKGFLMRYHKSKEQPYWKFVALHQSRREGMYSFTNLLKEGRV